MENNFMSDQLGTKASRYKRQRLLAVAIFVAVTASARGEIQPVVGHVVELNGDWFVYASARGDARSQRLSKWQDLPAGGVVRIKSPSTGDYINIVDENAQELIERLCSPIDQCFPPLYLPQSADEKSSTDPFGAALRQVWNLLSGGEYEPSMHRVRGLLLQSEGVVPIVDGGIDLGEPMHGIIKGRYTLATCKQEATCEQEANPKPGEQVVFDWSPELTTIALVGRLPPGLYGISSEDGSDQGASGLKISVRILVCASQAFSSTRYAFRKTRMLADKWSGETAHAFLRAYLVQLNRSGICMNQ
jgi:hypothetical protein